MKRFLAIGVVLVFPVLVSAAAADEKSDPTGTWKWSVPGRNNTTRDVTLKLKLADGKLTGAMVGRNDKDTAIEEPTYKDGEISFKVTRERNGKKSTTSYTGKVSGDTLKGKVESERNGEKQSKDWEAKRSKEEKK